MRNNLGLFFVGITILLPFLYFNVVISYNILKLYYFLQGFCYFNNKEMRIKIYISSVAIKYYYKISLMWSE